LINQTQALALGIVQGLTEFLPISSSGHLVLGQKLLGLSEPELLFDVVVHVGTLLAVTVYFHKDIFMIIRSLWARDQKARQGRRFIILLAIGSVPAALAGFLLKDLFESLFASILAVGCALLFTGFFLLLTRLAPNGQIRLPGCGPGRAFAVGIAQALAITPGVSRSGSTIACGLLLGLERSFAARLSFLLSIPAILGALLLQVLNLSAGQAVDYGPLITGGLSAAISGYLALIFLIKLVHQGRLHLFAPYCFLVGGLAIAWSLLA
jgi:undecaprenyl-diphosphatase